MYLRILTCFFLLFPMRPVLAQVQDSLHVASLHHHLDSLYSQGQYAQAGDFALEVIEAWESIEQWEKALDCRKVRLYCLGLTRNLNDARKELNTIQELCEAHIAEDDPKRGLLYNCTVALHVWQGDYAKAVAWTDEQNIFWKNQESLDAAAAFINRGIANFYISECWKSIEYCQQGLEILEKIGQTEHLFAANAHLCIGRSFLSLRHFRESEQYFNKALSHYQSQLRPDHPSLIVARNNICSLYYQKEDWEKAAQQGRANLKITRKALGRHNLTAEDHFNIGRALMRIDSLDKAEANFKNALSIQQEVLPSSHPDIAMTRLYLGRTYRAQKRLDRSMQVLQEGIDEVVDNRISSVRNDMYRAIGFIYEDRKQWQQALEWFDKCLNAFKKEGKWLSIAHKRGIIELLSQKAFVLTKLTSLPDNKRYRIAAETLIESRDLLDSMRYFIRPEEEAAHAQNADYIYSLGAYVCYKLYQIHQSDYWLEESFSFAEKRRASLLLQSLRSRQAHRFAGVPELLLRTERRARTGLLFSEQQLQKEKAKGDGADSLQLARWEEEMLAYRFRLDSVRSLVSRTYPSYHRMKYDEHTARLSEVQQALKSDQDLFIQYSWTPSHELIAFFASPTKRGAIKIPHTETWQDSLANFIAMVNNGVQAENTGYTAESRQAFARLSTNMYEGLLAPILDQTETQVDRLVIVPQGQLGYLPFSLLLKQAPAQETSWETMPFLLHKHAIRYAWSATLFCTKEKTTNNRSKLLGGFAPDYRDLDESSSLLATRSLAPLTENQPEVELITAMTGGKSHLGAAASEAAFKSLAGEYRLLHLAMHALVNDSLPLYSSLVFSDKGEEEQEDGQLYAYEIYNLPLQAEMLVLSACETGYGKQREGEGIMSLAHAFHYAGCPNIVTSLWQADDKSTARLMELFYSELKKGVPKDKALQTARISYLAEGNQAHPFFWGAFVLVGDDEPVAMGGNGDSWMPWLLFALMVAIGVWSIIRENKAA